MKARGTHFITTTIYVFVIVISLLIVTVFFKKDAIEVDLLQRSRIALANQNLEYINLDFSGRDADLTGFVNNATDRDKAISLLKQVDGIRVVDNQISIRPEAALAETTEVLTYTPVISPLTANLEKIDLSKIEFKYAKTHISPQSLSTLQQVAKALKDKSDVLLKVSAHTDNSGTTLGQLALSEERAKAVKRTLIKLGVEPTIIVTQGYGASKPITSNATEQGRKINQRIEMTVIK